MRNERIGRREDWIISQTKMNELKKKYLALRDENQSLKQDKEALQIGGELHYYCYLFRLFQVN